MDGIQTFQELQPNRLVQKVITSIHKLIGDFPYSEEFENELIKKKNENQHSAAFCLFMANFSPFNFMREISQKGSHTIDIGVYQGAVLIFVLEAKLLPTPVGTKQKPRLEHEYVYGKGAGIQRFKEGFHGVDNVGSPFPECGMIAYVKEKDLDYWFQKVNQWILNARWEESEQLQKSTIDKTAILISNHSRQDTSMIRLHHFWVKVQ